MPFVTAVKYGTGSCLAYFYASRFLKNKHYAVIAGVIYMFSSFSGYNVIFHFSDVIALFPLLLIAVEELCVNNRRCVFALTVCFMALLNYYFFAGQAVFCVIYFFVRFFDRRFVNTLKKLLSVAFEAVTGFAMSAVFMLPVLFYLSASSKATGMISLSDAPLTGCFLPRFRMGLPLSSACAVSTVTLVKPKKSLANTFDSTTRSPLV